MSTPSLVWSATAFSAAHWIWEVSSRIRRRLSGAAWMISAITALASVVLPDPVPPEMTMLSREVIALRMTQACCSVIIFAATIVVEWNEPGGAAPDGEGRRRHDGRQQALEPVATDRQLSGNDRAFIVGF